MTKVTGFCTADGCDRLAVSRPSFCLKHYKRWKRRGTTHDITAEERFFGTVVEAGDCWVWTGSVQIGGYGKFVADKRHLLAHRWSYEFFIGEIPVGLPLDHLCSNRSCVNPWHLEPVTTRVNVLRSNGIPAHNARKTHCIRGHAFDETNTYIKPSNGSRDCRTCRAAADRRYALRNRR